MATNKGGTDKGGVKKSTAKKTASKVSTAKKTATKVSTAKKTASPKKPATKVSATKSTANRTTKTSTTKNSTNSGMSKSEYAKKKQMEKRLFAIITVIVILVFCGLWAYDYFFGTHDDGGGDYVYNEGDTAVHFLNVGQGDCILIHLPDQKYVIIDSGTSAQSENIIKHITKLDITHFDIVLLTHTDADHSGGFAGQGANPNGVLTMEGLTFDKVFMPKIKSSSAVDPLAANEQGITTAPYRNFVTAAVNGGAEINYTSASSGTILSGTGYSLDVLAPASTDIYEEIGDSSSAKDKNKVSSMLMLEYYGRRVLFTGDAVGETEQEFLQRASFFDFKVDVLKIAHHGSITNGSNSQAFLDFVQPRFAVISVKEGRYNNMPATQLFDRLNKVSRYSRTFRTDIDGDIICTLTKDSRVLWWTASDGNVRVTFIKTDSFEALFVSIKRNYIS